MRCRKNALGQLNPGNPRSVADCIAEVKDFFQRNLEAHFAAEEGSLFPVLSEYEDARAVVEELLREHDQMRLQAMGREPPDLRKYLFEFGDILERHIRTEERVLFPMFEALVSAETAERVGREIRHILGSHE